MRSLREHVRDIIEQVPEGSVTTFGDVAAALGDPVAARAVAAMVLEDIDPGAVPTHRVVRADGTMGAYPQGEEEKAGRLAAEGVPLEMGRVADLDAARHQALGSDRPLERLRLLQEELRERRDPGPLEGTIDALVGVDVAYAPGGAAFASRVEVDPSTLSVVDTHVVGLEVDFPYIPTYLSFREMPAVRAALEGADLGGSLLFIDGQGTLHPRRFGIACHAGVELGVPTVGVAKSPLCGSYDRDALASEGHAPVLVGSVAAGWAIAPGGGAGKAVFASPGNMVSTEQALPLVLDSMGRRQPVPLELAHEAATRARRGARPLS